MPTLGVLIQTTYMGIYLRFCGYICDFQVLFVIMDFYLLFSGFICDFPFFVKIRYSLSSKKKANLR